MTRIEVAWLAGLVEGEGSFVITHRATLTVAMTDLDIVERLPRLTGVGNLYAYKTKAAAHHKDVYGWTVGKQRHLLAVTRSIRPWLGARRGESADAVLAWLEARMQRFELRLIG